MSAANLLKENPKPTEAADPRRHLRQLLPLHRLSAHRQRRAVRGEQEVVMSTPVLPKLVGQRVKRREDPRLIQGLGHLRRRHQDRRHAAPGVQAQRRRARTHHVDRRQRRAGDGRRRGRVHRQADRRVPRRRCRSARRSRRPTHHAVATDVVRFAGEPVAVVVAADRYIARDAADAIVVLVRHAAGGRRPRAGDDRQAGADPQGLPQQPRAAARARAAPAWRPTARRWTTPRSTRRSRTPRS